MYQDEKNEEGIIDDLELVADNIESVQDFQEKEKTLDDIEKSENDTLKNKTQNNQAILSKAKVILIKKLLKNIKENSDQLNQMLFSVVEGDLEEKISIGQNNLNSFSEKLSINEDANIIEGFFDGENMIGPDGKQYSVPANYASKSKLIEGDILKLTITNRGTFVYKQISPIDRIRVIGELDQDAKGNFIVRAEDKKWRVLTASVTYYKGDVGDEVVIIVPKKEDSNWGAIDNIVKK